jgi:hypothetical protein
MLLRKLESRRSLETFFAGLSEESDGSEEFELEEDDDEDRPSKPSHVCFDK